ncbi:Rad52/Rad22 family DNA repair protein [Nonomuraea sp. NPDC050536]|uniref:Rad52/Rad22 family DNA repair protein n=1 Tax=Nonomuraea sp. NPDC050536 TaxID=3364366 RepID=UPI0037C7DE7D
MGFTRAQVDQLLQPINTNRVLKDGKGHSHVSQQDVLAHLIRIFGFGNFDTEILSLECVFETPRVNDQTGKQTGRWDVCYKATYRLIVKDENGVEVCHFEDGSTATAQNQTRGDAHDLAMKSALSLAKKRAAIPLGDQFGLSLYNKGQTKPLVIGTLVMPEGEAAGHDVQEGVEKQVSLGNDEIDRDLDASLAEPAQPTPQVSVDDGWVDAFGKRVAAATADQIGGLRQEVLDKFKARSLDSDTGNRLMEAIKQRQAELSGQEAA